MVSPEPDQQQRTSDSLSQEIERLKVRVLRLTQEPGETQGKHYRLRRRIAESEALITKDSTPSNRYPQTGASLGGGALRFLYRV